MLEHHKKHLPGSDQTNQHFVSFFGKALKVTDVRLYNQYFKEKNGTLACKPGDGSIKI